MLLLKTILVECGLASSELDTCVKYMCTIIVLFFEYFLMLFSFRACEIITFGHILFENGGFCGISDFSIIPGGASLFYLCR